uniref:C-type lectin domain-containing protein n=1 Tax=Nothobranchius furzeri TaxID=105023 RepID=A0A8C6LJM4_NOTFU
MFSCSAAETRFYSVDPALLLSGLLTPEGLCPPGWTWYEGRCYLFVDSAKDWADAEKYCNLFGGNLASYHSEDDYNFIRHLIYRAAHSDRQSWVGGNDAVQDCTWFWSDGSNFDYTNWGRGEPDNRGGNQKCMDINKNGMDFVNDVDCSRLNPFVCSMKA